MRKSSPALANIFWSATPVFKYLILLKVPAVVFSIWEDLSFATEALTPNKIWTSWLLLSVALDVKIISENDSEKLIVRKARSGKTNEIKIDTVKVYWPSGKYEEIYNINSNTTLTVVEKNANRTRPYKLEKEKTLFNKSKNIISFKHTENTFNDFKKEILLPYKQSSLGPFITKGDANGDGIDDLYIGGAHNQSGALYIKKNNSYVKMNSKAFKEDSEYEDMEALFVDIDSDGDNDLYVISGGSEFIENDSALKDRIYLNDFHRAKLQ